MNAEEFLGERAETNSSEAKDIGRVRKIVQGLKLTWVLTTGHGPKQKR